MIHLKAPINGHFFGGETYVLIGPKTYSSANMFTNAISTYKLGTLIGRPTGERTNDFGEPSSLQRPDSFIRLFPYLSVVRHFTGYPFKVHTIF